MELLGHLIEIDGGVSHQDQDYGIEKPVFTVEKLGLFLL